MIEIKNISKKFGKKVLLNNVSFVIPDNSIFGIQGASGSGKTTLLNIIGLIEEKDSGEVFYDGEKITSNNQIKVLHRKDISFIFQNSGLIANETVFQNMELLYSLRNKSKQKKKEEIRKHLGELGIEDLIDNKVYELSGGEQQRVALAKCLLKDAKYILADEFTASLDDKNRDLVLHIIKKIKERGKTIVIVSHDDEVLKICDYIYNLDTGRIKDENAVKSYVEFYSI